MQRGVCLATVAVLATTAPSWAGEGVVALQTAAPSCRSLSGFYTKCDNGTVTDNRTGLVWLANADCFGSKDWYAAMKAVAGLSDLPDDGEACSGRPADWCDCGLADGSSPGEWRLPSIEEWETMVEHADDVLSCSPTITDDSGTFCWTEFCSAAEFCSFYQVREAGYWSSSSDVTSPSEAWAVNLDDGNVDHSDKDLFAYIWPVRGGQ